MAKELEEYASQIAQCVRCGACQADCPTYRETGQEGAVARGKIALASAVLAGKVALEPRLVQDMSCCLLCGACVSKCPNRVETDAIVAAVRRRLTKEHGLSPIGKGVAALTGSKSLIKGLIKGADTLSSLLFRKLPESSGLRLRFGPEVLKDRVLPPLSEPHLLARVPELSPGVPDKTTVGFFAGCAITYLYPRVGETLVRLLTGLGYSVILPRDQGCCGMPALSSGNGPLLDRLAAANVNAFQTHPVKAIITACASCSGALHGHYAGLYPGFGDFARAVTDIHVFLAREGIVDRLAALPKAAHRLRVTYHDPCHLRTQGITREPRDLLHALPQVDFVEMEGAALCCGLGGSFAVAQPELSRRIAERKAAGLAASGAELVASSCPGCVLQLQDIITRAGLAIKAVHTLDLVAQTLRQHNLP